MTGAQAGATGAPEAPTDGRTPQQRVRGGRAAAEAALAHVDPAAYGRTRNHLDGAVTRLSAYLRHGVLTLAEVRRTALATALNQAYRFVDQLSWRDFFVRVYAQVGAGIWDDFEPYKTGRPAAAYRPDMPPDVAAGTTGLRCIDAWSEELVRTGYLHNHVRMYLASYLVHHRVVSWQAGARWFLTHLLDGDPAANNGSWQWVASTWRRSPYLWNRANLLANGGGRLCDACPLRDAGCPFATTYAALTARLFPDGAVPVENRGIDRASLTGVAAGAPPTPTRSPDPVLVWVHGERLALANEALVAYPRAPAVFVWDTELWERNGYAGHRREFIGECLAELPVEEAQGDVAEVLLARAARAGARVVATTASPSPRFGDLVRRMEAAGLQVQIWPGEPFCPTPDRLTLWRHAPYWYAVRSAALTP